MQQDEAILDELSGFEFEDVMVDVFRRMGFNNVQKAAKVADKGRDITMEEYAGGETRAVIVECKHTETVSRPVLQKLHSAIATYDYDGPKRGMVVTTGTFTGPAKEYAEKLHDAGDPYPIELFNGNDLRDVSEEIGLDLYNGRVEVLCDETLRPYSTSSTRPRPLRETLAGIENLDAENLSPITAELTFIPTIRYRTATRETFSTSVGVIRRLDERDIVVVKCDTPTPELAPSSLSSLVDDNYRQAIDLEAEKYEQAYAQVEKIRFNQSETEYTDWVIDYLQTIHTETVYYTGDNNVTYDKTCEPSSDSIDIQEIQPVYVPYIESEITIGDRTYRYRYYSAWPNYATDYDGVRKCIQCGTQNARTYSYCPNCDSINCQDHIKTERWEDEPICTGCALTERFFFKKKYFYTEENLEAFREEYEEMPLHVKAAENQEGVAVAILATVIVLAIIIGAML